MGHPFQKEVLVAQKLAQEAGDMAKSIQASAGFSLKKNGAGPVSEADLRADKIIKAGLAAEFAQDLIISEESADENDLMPQGHRIWLVDPIDGTADFVQGGNDYSVMIGLLVDGSPALGVIYEPFTSTTWTGVVWKEDSLEKRFAERSLPGQTPQPLLTVENHDLRPRVTISKNHPSKLADKLVKLLEPSEIIKKGSLGLKVALIAEGQADIYLAATRRIKVWDTCAPFALLKAVGGFAYTMKGKSVIFGPTLTHTTPFFVASGHFAPQMLKELAKPAFDFIKDF